MKNISDYYDLIVVGLGSAGSTAVLTAAKLLNASFRAIDNNDDGIVDVIFIWEYQAHVVERVYADECMVYFRDTSLQQQLKYVTLDIEDDSDYVVLLDKTGKYMGLDEIKPDMVASIAISKDKEMITVIFCSDSVEGILEELSEDALKIDNTGYKYDMDIKDLKLGDLVKLFLDFRGLAVFYDSVAASENYAYVLGVAVDGGISSDGQVKLLIPGPIATRYKETEDLEMGGEATRTPQLFARNEKIEIVRLAPKVLVNGKSVAKAELSKELLQVPDKPVKPPVKYFLDSEGRINSFFHLKSVDDATSKTYNANELTFGAVGDVAFGITQNKTLALCIPKSPSATNDDHLVFIKLSNNIRYDVIG